MEEKKPGPTPDFRKIAEDMINKGNIQSPGWQLDKESVINMLQGAMEVTYEYTAMPLQSELSSLKEEVDSLKSQIQELRNS